MTERILRGRVAVPGIAAGPTFWAEPLAVAATGPTLGLDEAVARAAGELEALIAEAEPTAADILTFQLALLEDEELLAPARSALARGSDPWAALDAAFAPLIADYRGSDDPTFAARAADLADLQSRLGRCLTGSGGDAATPPHGAILLARDLPPSRFVELARQAPAGVALAAGGAASHVAILARGRGVPLLFGLGEALLSVEAGADAVLDSDLEALVVAPSTARRAAALGQARDARARDAEAARGPALTRAGRAIAVRINADHPEALDALDPMLCDGIGLVRTEFLFEAGAPAEEEQLAAYRRILDWAGGRPVTFRTLDAGGDKPVPGVTLKGERNPFLGLRGLRLCLVRPELFRTQLRALARAAASAPCEVMLPMVTRPDEVTAARAHLEAVIAELARDGVPHARPRLGIMVEVPSAALRPQDFMAEFYSIGSNDLVQYVTAVARDDPQVAALADPRDPAVLELIGRVVSAGQRLGRPVSLCGDMASDPALVPTLLDLGLTCLSVAPASLGAVKTAIRAHTGAPR